MTTNYSQPNGKAEKTQIPIIAFYQSISKKIGENSLATSDLMSFKQLLNTKGFS